MWGVAQVDSLRDVSQPFLERPSKPSRNTDLHIPMHLDSGVAKRDTRNSGGGGGGGGGGGDSVD